MMAKKKSKLKTPEWILEGYDSEADYNKAKGFDKKKKKSGKTFRIRKCPKCGSDDVGVVIGGEEGKGCGEWKCNNCEWTGCDIEEQELTEDEFMKYLDELGEDIS